MTGKLPIFAGIMFAVLSIGCGLNADGPSRYEVSGTVTFDGQPLPYGEITFAPDGSRGNQGPGAVVPIENGVYHVDAKKGVIGGPHVVSITGYSASPTSGAVVAASQSQPKRLFATYTESVNLPEANAQQDFQVPGKL
ncbi:hypothetical protein AB1K70_18045 [Bremerella sp. JC770]|uniref:hypothetical protein n=1 Tax=Bremerella sp. JC770 TaxID=3232137 RepID=UPI00345B2761